MSWKINPWLQTDSGLGFYFFEPDEKQITIEDIAHSASNNCRFSGHTKTFFSVAQHSCNVHDIFVDRWKHDEEDEMFALLHDAAEPYISDIPAGIKQHIFVLHPVHKEYIHINDFENGLLRDYILPKFTGASSERISEWLDPSHPVWIADAVALMWEKRDVLRKHMDWNQKLPADQEIPTQTIDALYPEKAWILFFNRYRKLKQKLRIKGFVN